MVEHHVEHQTDASLVRLCDQFLYVCHCAVSGIDIIVIRDIISVVVLRRYEERSEPDIVHAQFLDIVQFLDHAPEVTQAVFVGVTERLRINLIYSAFSEICFHNLETCPFLYFLNPA